MNDAQMTDHLVGFVDLLGFSAAVDAKDSVALNKILKLLMALQAQVGGYEDQYDPRWNVREVRPNVSAFSDHIVISFPSNLGWGYCTASMAIMVAGIARLALDAGFLIRGALTWGQLYHDSSVVFGPALVKVARMESQLAIYPRIIMDHESVSKVGMPPPASHYFRDRDGFWCVDYLLHLFLEEGSNTGGLDTFEKYRAHQDQKFTKLLETVASQLSELSKVNFGHGREKWEWFRSDIRRVRNYLLDGKLDS